MKNVLRSNLFKPDPTRVSGFFRTCLAAGLMALGSFSTSATGALDVNDLKTSSEGAEAVSMPAPPIKGEPPFEACSPQDKLAVQRYWYFGVNAGLDFGKAGGMPSVISGPLDVQETSVVATTQEGDLLFSASENGVLDASGTLMPNGGGLKMGHTPSNGMVTFQSPTQNNIYFLVYTSATLPGKPNGQLYYSVVNMALNGGAGDIPGGMKNIPLGDNTGFGEALEVFPNADGTGYWVVAMRLGSKDVFTFEFDETGYTGKNNVSKVNQELFEGYANMAITPDLKRLAMVSATFRGNKGDVYIFDLDGLNGELVRQFTVPIPNLTGLTQAYGVEWSASGDILYLSTVLGDAHLYQYVVANKNNAPAIKMSEVDLGTIGGQGGGIKRGPDGKIYVSNGRSNALSVVNQPDLEGMAADFKASTLDVGTFGMFGFPSFQISCGNAELDTDGDGVPNSVDIDDDDDGVTDLIEKALAQNMGDTDGDGIPDDLDLDSDGDGIPDIVEAQSTADYKLPLGTDQDGDGLDDAFDPDCSPCGVTFGFSLDIPENTDGQLDRPDIEDPDTDNDGFLDAEETGIVLTGKDSDGDGLDDAVDTDDLNFGPVNADIVDLLAYYPSEGGEVNWRRFPSANTRCDMQEAINSQRYWYFGNFAGLDFNGGGVDPVPLNGFFRAHEGSTVVSDLNGNLLFSSNGEDVYDASGTVMPNGGNLKGSNSAVQVAVAFQSSSNPTHFFLVYTSAKIPTAPNGALYYSEVDMALNGGLGDIIPGRKNIQIEGPGEVSEALTVTPDVSGNNVWVLGTKAGTDEYYAWRFDGNGYTGLKVTSHASQVNFMGYPSLRFNADYSMLAAVTSQYNDGSDHRIHVFKFNPANGIYAEQYVVNGAVLKGQNRFYSADFSPDGTKLYLSTARGEAHLYQYDLTPGLTQAQIQASRTDLGIIGGSGGQVACAPDGKMYVAEYLETTLGVVEDPNALGMAATFEASTQQLAMGSNSEFGLPNLFPSCFDLGQMPPEFSAANGTLDQALSANTAPQIAGELFPNPSKSGLAQLKLDSGVEGNASLIVSTVDGVVLQTKKVHVHEGQSVVPFDGTWLNAGSYMVFLQFDDGRVLPMRFWKTAD